MEAAAPLAPGALRGHAHVVGLADVAATHAAAAVAIAGTAAAAGLAGGLAELEGVVGDEAVFALGGVDRPAGVGVGGSGPEIGSGRRGALDGAAVGVEQAAVWSARVAGGVEHARHAAPLTVEEQATGVVCAAF